MNKIASLLAVAAVVLVSSCATAQPPPALNADAFQAHFTDEEKCSTFVEDLVSPAAENMADLSTVRDMRSWLANHPKDSFSNVVTEVQRATKKYGVMHPERESDQIRTTKTLYVVLKKFPGFSDSGCGPDVREDVMNVLYNGIGGPHSRVIGELEKNSIKESSGQRWVLLTAIMVGDLPKEWADQ